MRLVGLRRGEETPVLSGRGGTNLWSFTDVDFTDRIVYYGKKKYNRPAVLETSQEVPREVDPGVRQ